MIFLYANAGDKIGLGHVFRLFPLFSYLKQEKIDVRMYAPLPNEKIESLGIQGIKPLRPGLDAVLSLGKKISPKLVFFDSYEQPNRLIKEIGRQNTKVICFDDHFRIRESLDSIVNPAPFCDRRKYNGFSKQNLIGPKYFPIADPFFRAREKVSVRDSIGRVLVSLGGNDAQKKLNMLLPILGSNFFSTYKFDVIGFSGFASKNRNINKIGWLNQNDLSQVISDYDLAIIAGGSMLHQCAFLGIPSISWPQTENQIIHAKKWERVGSTLVVNNPLELKAAFGLLNSKDVRIKMNSLGKQTVMGKGVAILAKHIFGLLRT